MKTWMGGEVLSEWVRYIQINPDALPYFRSKEVSLMRVDPPAVIRCDGVNFGKALKGYRSPRDWRVHNALLGAAEEFMRIYGGEAALVISDEINILMHHLPYSGRVVKLSSVAASFISSHVSLVLGRCLSFDGRVIPLLAREVVPYFLLRVRVGLNNYVSMRYHAAAGTKARTPPLKVMLERLKERGLLRNAEMWEGLGTLVTWSRAVKEGYNPLMGERVEVLRRVLSRYPAKLDLVVRYLGEVVRHSA
ncbi:MAG: hypothetical protein J7L55_05130 [Desulfurococcales archaeon]|nr:hypothetical protein [Desulfurococcales archaeon]